MEAIKVTRLFYVFSVTSHLRATYDAVGNVGDESLRDGRLICAQRLALDRLVEHVCFAFDTTNLAA